ncbi:proton-dependent oligopeptide transporter family [Ampelomyces quisqualis]|uniref:Proton-dependent oligopeptide transporter family n=1 Tax=Ampelomyces quisqualis TaxID=50730 RepID=A0A6A5QG63_AMPQU|nr:proton-dependent oligopeptide transporter family [Ampelomyces quisqualis]
MTSVYALGLAVLTGTAFSQQIHGTGGLPGFIIGALLIGAGVGAVRPNMTVFIIDQCPEEEPQILKLKNGSSVVTSRELTIQYIYNVNYWVINVGGLAGIVTTLTEKHAGFGYAFLISLCLMLVAAALFQAGYFHFNTGFDEFLVTAPPAGNVLTSVLRALRRRRDPNYQKSIQSGLEAQPAAQQDGAATASEDDILLSETKAALKACLLFLPFPALMLCIDIMDSGLVAEAGSMQTHGLPNDIMYNLNPIAVMILMPLFQGWLYPFLAKRKINFTPQHRIGVGLACAALAIGYTAGIQKLIYISGPCFARPLKCLSGDIPNDVSVGIQTPTYVFLALGKILAIVAGTELAYTRAPANMKSIVQAVFLLFSALGAVIGVGASFAAEDPNMVIVYGSIAGFLALVTVAFEFAVMRKTF